MILAAAGVNSNLTLTLPLVLIVCVFVLLWDDLARMFEREPRDDFDEETTLEEWIECFPERHLTLLDRQHAVGGGTSPAREDAPPTKGTETFAP